MKSHQTDKIPEDFLTFIKKTAKKVLRYEAQLILRKYNPKIIAIAGSVGKTLTKEAIYLALSKKFYVRKSGKSFTAELGVPLTIIGYPHSADSLMEWASNILFGLKMLVFKRSYPEWLILEIDNDKPGDMKAIASLISPDILVMTAVGEVPAHIESFGSLENFISEKKALVSAVKRNGVVVFNGDDEHAIRVLVGEEVRKISCGISMGDIRGSAFQVLYSGGKKSGMPAGMSFDIEYGTEKHEITISDTLGVHNEYAVLLAFAVGLEMGLPARYLVNTIQKYSPLPGRLRILPGIKETLLVDDSYNASPIAMKEALSVFRSIRTKGRKIAVIGDMLELGKFSAEEHRKVAGLLKHSIDIVLTVGLRAKKIAEELVSHGSIKDAVFSFDNSDEAGIKLQEILIPGDIIFIKGSQAMRMEKVVEEVMQNPKDKKKLLVRQEENWVGR